MLQRVQYIVYMLYSMHAIWHARYKAYMKMLQRVTHLHCLCHRHARKLPCHAVYRLELAGRAQSLQLLGVEVRNPGQ